MNGHDQAYTLTIKAGSRFALPVPESREGYTLVGWYVGEYGTADARWSEPEEGDPNLKSEGTKIDVTGALTLTAIWQAE